MIEFHGGCNGCTQQEDNKEGADFCINCQYFDADWSLKDLNNRKKTVAETAREEIKKRLIPDL